MARQSHILLSRSKIVLFSSSTWGRADQQTSRDSNRVWDVLFCGKLPSTFQIPPQTHFPTRLYNRPGMRAAISRWRVFLSLGLLTATAIAQVVPNKIQT